MRKLNNMTRAVILLAICVLSIAAISFSWLSRPRINANIDKVNYGKLTLSTDQGAATSGGTEEGTGGAASSQIKAYTRMDNSSTAVTAKTYLATIDAETGKYEQSTEIVVNNNNNSNNKVKIGVNDCTYMITTLTNSSEIPTRVSLLIPKFKETVTNVKMYSYAPYKDQADEYIVKNIEVVSGSPVTVKWYFANGNDTEKTLEISTLPAVEYFK